MVQLSSSRAGGTVKGNAAPERGVHSYRQMGQGDGLIAKWIGAQVFRVFEWVIRTGRSQMQACWRRAQQGFPFRLDSLRAETGARQLINTDTSCCSHD